VPLEGGTSSRHPKSFSGRLSTPVSRAALDSADQNAMPCRSFAAGKHGADALVHRMDDRRHADGTRIEGLSHMIEVEPTSLGFRPVAATRFTMNELRSLNIPVILGTSRKGRASVHARSAGRFCLNRRPVSQRGD